MFLTYACLVLLSCAGAIAAFVMSKGRAVATQPIADSLGAKPAVQPPPGLGPELYLEYVDAKGSSSQRMVSIVKISRERQGLLEEYTTLETWCHLAQDKRTFLVERISSAKWPQGRIGREPRETISEIADKNPELVRMRRTGGSGLPSWVFDRSYKVIPVKGGHDLLVRQIEERKDLRVTLTDIMVAPNGVVTAIRVRNHTTKRKNTFHLAHLKQIADAETGELIEGDAQGWLKGQVVEQG